MLSPILVQQFVYIDGGSRLGVEIFYELGGTVRSIAQPFRVTLSLIFLIHFKCKVEYSMKVYLAIFHACEQPRWAISR